MTTIQLREELFREMNPLLDSKSALEKMLAYVKTLLPAKKAKSEIEEQTDDEKLEAALNVFHSDWGGDADPMEITKELRHNVVNSRTIETW